MFKNKTILVTGGTGSFGKAFIKNLLIKKYPFRRIIVFSRDELKQHQMSQTEIFDEKKNNQLRYFLGDIRDENRVKQALKDVDYVIHAAALKQVPAAEYNPQEFIKTNVIGTQNIVNACLESNVQKAILLSTDKASSPINLYGATKLCADKLFTSANNIVGKKKISFSVVRYGNVMGSRGSVIETFLKQRLKNEITITHPEMTRFNIFLDQAVEMVLWSLKNCKGGEIVVPKIPSFRVTDLAKSFGKNIKIKIIGTRPGEKIHEEMISVYDSVNTLELKDYFIIIPDHLKNFYNKNKIGKRFKNNQSYNSKTNNNFLSISDLRKIIKRFEK
jgi:UDP-N-acetylglucosamine 4,6-dehydratase (inverting)